jgi:predicted ferric reductase
VLLASGLVVHVLYVSGSFESGPPRAGLLLAAGLFGALWLWIRIRPLVLRSRGYEVKSVRRAGGETYTIELRPDGGRPLRHAPGQFAFLRFRSAFLSPEEHPFTIASPPDRPLSFTIRCSGDWTGDIWRLAPGVRAAVQGPYGLFSHLAHPGNRDLAMIAGGVGITPMLSMLRYMQDRGEDRKATLVWSNRTRRDILCLEEIGELADSLPGLTVIHVLTRERFEGMEHGRLDRGRLSRHLQGCSRGCLVFLCGPPAMMRQVRSDLRALGFSRRRIISEEFRL